MKAFYREYSYLNSWDVADLGSVWFFFLFLEILEAFIRKLAAEFSSSFYIKILGVYMKKKKSPQTIIAHFQNTNDLKCLSGDKHGWQLDEA